MIKQIYNQRPPKNTGKLTGFHRICVLMLWLHLQWPGVAGWVFSPPDHWWLWPWWAPRTGKHLELHLLGRCAENQFALGLQLHASLQLLRLRGCPPWLLLWTPRSEPRPRSVRRKKKAAIQVTPRKRLDASAACCAHYDVVRQFVLQTCGHWVCHQPLHCPPATSASSCHINHLSTEIAFAGISAVKPLSLLQFQPMHPANVKFHAVPRPWDHASFYCGRRKRWSKQETLRQLQSKLIPICPFWMPVTCVSRKCLLGLDYIGWFYDSDAVVTYIQQMGGCRDIHVHPESTARPKEFSQNNGRYSINLNIKHWKCKKCWLSVAGKEKKNQAPRWSSSSLASGPTCQRRPDSTVPGKKSQKRKLQICHPLPSARPRICPRDCQQGDLLQPWSSNGCQEIVGILLHLAF